MDGIRGRKQHVIWVGKPIDPDSKLELSSLIAVHASCSGEFAIERKFPHMYEAELVCKICGFSVPLKVADGTSTDFAAAAVVGTTSEWRTYAMGEDRFPCYQFAPMPPEVQLRMAKTRVIQLKEAARSFANEAYATRSTSKSARLREARQRFERVVGIQR